MAYAGAHQCKKEDSSGRVQHTLAIELAKSVEIVENVRHAGFEANFVQFGVRKLCVTFHSANIAISCSTNFIRPCHCIYGFVRAGEMDEGRGNMVLI